MWGSSRVSRSQIYFVQLVLKVNFVFQTLGLGDDPVGQGACWESRGTWVQTLGVHMKVCACSLSVERAVAVRAWELTGHPETLKSQVQIR